MLWQLPWRGLGRGHRVSEYKFMPKATEYRLKNTLSLFDRGYNSLDHLHETEQAHEFFMVRMKENMNPRILWANHKDQRRDVYFRNRPLQEIKLNRKENYDFNVIFNKKKFQCLRVIALWNPVTKKHVLFLTNADVKRLPLRTIGQIYRLRWQIELTFKELKSFSELREFLRGNANIVQGFIWTAFCAFLIRRFIVTCAQEFTEMVLSFHKTAISSRTFMLDFTRCVLKRFIGLKQCLTGILEYLSTTMHISNPQRPSSFQLAVLKVKTGVLLTHYKPS